MSKWIKKLRALPSDPSSEDFLKVEYVEVNLNNSRKLIVLVSKAATESEALAVVEQNVVENLLPLRSIRCDLSWLDELLENDAGDDISSANSGKPCNIADP